MTSTIIIISAAILALTHGAAIDPLQEYLQHRQSCLISTNADPLAVDKIFKGEKHDENSIGSVLFCINRKYNVQNENGDFNQENLKIATNQIYNNPENVDDFVKNCGVKREGTKPEQATIEFMVCARKYLQLEKLLPPIKTIN